MIAESGATMMDGLTVGTGGSAFFPLDDTASCAVFQRGSGAYGVAYEKNPKGAPYICIRPNWAMPPFARDQSEFGRWLFSLPGTKVMALRLDSKDGEIKYHINCDNLKDPASLGEVVDEALDYLDAQVWPELLKYIAERCESVKE